MSLLYIAIDGDDVGLQLRDYIVANDIDRISAYSLGIDSFFKEIRDWLSKKGFVIVFCGGDSVLAYTDTPEEINDLIEVMPTGLCKVSVGVGSSAEQSYLALQLAKARGKRQAVLLDCAEISTIKVWS